MKFALVTLVALFASLAHAEDPSFTYAAQEAAYASASPMTLDQVTASPWILVGKVNAPSKEHDSDFYDAGGMYIGSHNEGWYQEYITFTHGADKRGNPSLTAKETVWSVETGKLTKTFDYLFTVSPDAVLYTDRDRGATKSTFACRLVTATSMMLCKVSFNSDDYGASEGLYPGQAAVYLGYTAVSAPGQDQ